MVIRSFIKQGSNLKTFVHGRFEGRERFKAFTPTMRKFLLSPACLRNWMGNSLADRCAVINRRFKKNINTTMLFTFYRANDIKYRVNQMVYRNHLKRKKTLDEDRYAAAV